MGLILIVLLVALMIPLLAVILDSQVGRAIAARLEGGHGSDSLAERRLAALEEESAFLHQLLEKKRAPGALPPGDGPD